MSERERQFKLPESDERMLNELKQPIGDKEARRQPEEKIFLMEPELREPYCRELVKYYMEKCDRQLEIIGTFQDSPEKNELLDHWKKVRGDLEKGDPTGLLTDTEKRSMVQFNQLVEISGRIDNLPANNPERQALIRQKDHVLTRLDSLLSNERDLILIKNTLHQEITPEIKRQIRQELEGFCQKMIREAKEGESKIDESRWSKALAELKRGDIKYLYGILCTFSGELENEKNQLWYNINNPPKGMTEDEKSTMAQMVQDWTYKVKLLGETEALIAQIDTLKPRKE